MKKNKMMRLASGLLVATLLTTSIISGTLAKYTTQDDGSDTARVAKWGVTALVSGSLFGENYYGETDENGNEISAEIKGSADSSENIVAPGTQNTEGVTLSVTGTPEVANRVTVSADENEFNDICLKKGSYATLVKASGVTADNVTEYYVANASVYKKATDFTEGTTYYEVHDNVTLTEDYYPIKWALTEKGGSADYSVINNVGGLYEAIGEKFNTGESQSNGAGTPIDTTYVITWKWEFDQNQDGADTILGNIIAEASDQVVVKGTADSGYTAVTAADYNTTVKFNVTLTVTQVD